MKTNIKNLVLRLALIAGLNLIPTGRVMAQIFTTLYSFTAGSTNSLGVYTNSDGGNSYAGLTVTGNNNSRYGTASQGGSAGFGTVFAINTDGTGFTNLHSFTYSDGANPWAGLLLSGNTLYGTAYYGGSSSNGTVFAINTDGTGFTNLHSFSATDALGLGINGDGAYPNAGLILSGNTLFGTASRGGNAALGTVFAVNTDGTGFTNLYSFTAGPDGAIPVAGLILSGNTLYGTATGGGDGGNGTVFKVNTDGTGFSTLHSFLETQEIIPCSNGSCPPGYHCVASIPYNYCVRDTGGGCFCPPGSRCVGGICACAGFCGGG